MPVSKDSEDLTRVGPGTVMGEFMRQYWLPALKSDELVADGDPVRLLLLGEKLLAFRDTQGRVGVMQHQCPHRCASLFLGRNEQGGIRCTYHGWKFDVDGNCVDMPSVPQAQDFKDKVRARAYKVAERNGLIWVYMGPRDPAPPLPLIEATLLPEDRIDIIFIQRRCNFMQAAEGDIDTSHLGFLHLGQLEPADLPAGHPFEHTLDDRAPQYHVRDVPWGTSYGAFRALPDGHTYWRFSNFMFPFWTQTPQGEFPLHVHARGWVPMDDGHTMVVHVRWRPGESGMRSPLEPIAGGQPISGSRPTAENRPGGTGWTDRWRLVADESNDWLIDREAQRSRRIYSGIDNFQLQDQAVTESMGPITDHAWEHLGPGDLMIARTRRRLLQAARAFGGGQPAPGVDDPEIFLGSRSGYFMAPSGGDWQQLYADNVARCERPAQRGDAVAAEPQ